MSALKLWRTPHYSRICFDAHSCQLPSEPNTSQTLMASQHEFKSPIRDLSSSCDSSKSIVASVAHSSFMVLLVNSNP